MGLNFSEARWQETKENSRLWWAGELKRPLVYMRTLGGDPGRPEPELPSRFFTPFYDDSVSPEAIVDRWDYDISCFNYLGDSFPHCLAYLGAGAAAAFLGAKVQSDESAWTVWFHPTELRDIAELHFEYDPDNFWFLRIKELYRIAAARWGGQVQVAMQDLGGTLDLLSVFRPGAALLCDLYDHPEEVKRLTWELHHLWWRYFDELDAIVRPTNPGYTSWTPLFSTGPGYMLQCDFAYMLGPDMFDEFVKPELVATCRRLTNAFYHLDGIGQLAHLDSLLSIPELKGIQWVPGTGSPDYDQWPEVYRKIREAGKLVQVLGDIDVVDRVIAQLGSGEGVFCWHYGAEEAPAREFLAKHGVPSG